MLLKNSENEKMRKTKKFEAIPIVQRKKPNQKTFIMFPQFMIDSNEFRALSSSAKLLMLAMQMEHRTSKYTTYGHRQAMRVTGLSNRTVANAFQELMTNGFLALKKNYNHTEGKVRTWELTWMSYFNKLPEDSWI